MENNTTQLTADQLNSIEEFKELVNNFSIALTYLKELPDNPAACTAIPKIEKIKELFESFTHDEILVLDLIPEPEIVME